MLSNMPKRHIPGLAGSVRTDGILASTWSSEWCFELRRAIYILP
jgi:hypothetical protein